jgi:hypothetical protein
MKTQRQRLIFLGLCILIFVLGIEGISHDGWGLNSNDFWRWLRRINRLPSSRVF